MGLLEQLQAEKQSRLKQSPWVHVEVPGASPTPLPIPQPSAWQPLNYFKGEPKSNAMISDSVITKPTPKQIAPSPGRQDVQEYFRMLRGN